MPRRPGKRATGATLRQCAIPPERRVPSPDAAGGDDVVRVGSSVGSGRSHAWCAGGAGRRYARRIPVSRRGPGAPGTPSRR
jgi:hypothetical protein